MTHLSSSQVDQLRRTFAGEIVTPDAAGLRRGPPGLERNVRSASRDRRSADKRRRRPGRGAVRAGNGPRDRRSRWRAQRGRPLDLGRRPRHRHGRDERRQRGRGPADGHRGRRRTPRDAGHRGPGARARLSRGRRRPHGRRRADPRWWRRAAAAAVRADDRQPPRRRARDGRRTACASDGRGRAGAVLGPPRGRRELRRGDEPGARAPSVRWDAPSWRPHPPGVGHPRDLGDLPGMGGHRT